jgi:hypothetical protein
MKKLATYRQHAEECRRLAQTAALPQIRDQLLKLAETWDEMADQRERQRLWAVSSPEHRTH